MCVFCKILKGEIPSYRIYEDDDCLAILDITQATKGHTLVIPKKHFKDVFEVKDDIYLHVMEVAKKIAKHYMEVMPGMVGVNFLSNNGERAGQTVPHFHVHIVPRYMDDELVDMHFVDHSEFVNMQELCDLLKLN